MSGMICRFAAILALGVPILMASVPVDAVDCRYRDGTCIAEVSTSIYSGPISIPCPQGVQVIEVDVEIECGIGGPTGGSKIDHACADSNTPITIVDGAYTHTLQPKGNFTWGDVHADPHCGKLSYSIS